MIVVFDSTELDRDRRLSGTYHDLLRQHAGPLNLRQAIPEVVVREIANHVREDMKRAASANNDRLTKIEQSCGVTLGEVISAEQVRAKAAEYEEFLRAKLERTSIDILPVPDVDLGELLTRDLARRPPFDTKGKGFRDALIWESVKALAIEEGEEEVILVTSDEHFMNPAAESQNGETIHPLLQEELVEAGLVARVRVIRGLKKFLEEHVTAALERPERDIDQFLVENPGFSLDEFVAEAVAAPLLDADIPAAAFDQHVGFERAWIEQVTYVYDIEIDDEHELPTGDRLWELVAWADCDVYIEFSQPDYWSAVESGVVPGRDVDIESSVVGITFATTLPIQATLTVDLDANEVKSAEARVRER